MCNLSTSASALAMFLSPAFALALSLAGVSRSAMCEGDRFNLSATGCRMAVLQTHVALMGITVRALSSTSFNVEFSANFDPFTIVRVITILISLRTAAQSVISSLFDFRGLELGWFLSIGAGGSSTPTSSCGSEGHPTSGHVFRWRRCNRAIALQMVFNPTVLRVDFVARSFYPFFPISGGVLRCVVDGFTNAVVPGRLGVEFVGVFRYK